jgi:hypothetical protein
MSSFPLLFALFHDLDLTGKVNDDKAHYQYDQTSEVGSEVANDFREALWDHRLRLWEGEVVRIRRLERLGLHERC